VALKWRSAMNGQAFAPRHLLVCARPRPRRCRPIPSGSRAERLASRSDARHRQRRREEFHPGVAIKCRQSGTRWATRTLFCHRLPSSASRRATVHDGRPHGSAVVRRYQSVKGATCVEIITDALQTVALQHEAERRPYWLRRATPVQGDRRRLRQLGMVPKVNTRAELAALFKSEGATSGPIIRSTGFKPLEQG
jgi:hypothetical protein